MIIEYFYKVEGKETYPWAGSDVIVNGVDLIELLLVSDLASLEKIWEFSKTVFSERNTWWFNATKVVPLDGKVILSAAFDISSEMLLEIDLMKKILVDWQKFLTDGKVFEVNY